MHVDPPGNGLFTRARLIEAGLTSAAIEHRLATGRLLLVHRGVYSTAPLALTHFGRERAALLACGGGGVLSHRSAAVVWGLLRDRVGPVHVTIRSAHLRGSSGVRVHASRLERIDIRHREGLPLTCVLRTLHDLAASQPDELADAVNEALVRRLVQAGELVPVRGRRGAAALRAVLTAGAAPTRSEAERRFLRLVERARLPRPETNVRVAGHEVDALWRSQRLVAEVDGYAYHGRRDAFELDRRRDADLLAAGHRVLRVSWRQLAHEPEAIAARLATTLLSP